MTRSARLYLQDILDSIAKIQAYTQAGRAVFEQTPLIQDAVIRNFEVIGEVTKSLSLDLRETYPLVPWRKIAGLRDVLIHNYANVDLEIIWGLIEQDLPTLQKQVSQILLDLQNNE